MSSQDPWAYYPGPFFALPDEPEALVWIVEAKGERTIFNGKGHVRIDIHFPDTIDLTVSGTGSVTRNAATVIDLELADNRGLDFWLLLTAKKQWPKVNDKTRILQVISYGNLEVPVPRSMVEHYDTTDPDEPTFAKEEILLNFPVRLFGIAAMGYGPITDTLAVRYESQ